MALAELQGSVHITQSTQVWFYVDRPGQNVKHHRLLY